MDYVDYIGNVTRLAVELANTGGFDRPSELACQMFDEHAVARPARTDLGVLPELVGDALGQIVDRSQPTAVHRLLDRYPPRMHLSDHDGEGAPHIHFAARWASAAQGCGNFFVDQSRNRTRRFCSNACASRTTVAAYRLRTSPNRA